MKKEVLILLSIIIIISLAYSVLAQASDAKAYSCLEGKVKNKCASINFDDQEFSLLALAYDSGIATDCKAELMKNMKANECWPSSGCTLKQTAIALLALNNLGSSNSGAENWLLKQNQTPSDLIWYLQIDAREESTCKISYDNKDYPIKIDANKRLNIGAGSCLTLAQSNYWLKIESACINKNFKVSCDKDFTTSLIFKTLNSDTWFISSNTKSGSSNSATENQVNSLCLKENNQCNYEASLWAALALQKNHDISQFMPYLIALTSNNEKYNPNAFLSILTGADEYLSVMLGKQNPAGFWDLGSGFGRQYDTSLSLLALRDMSSEQADKAREWLLSTQSSDGCWGSIKDTSLILYAGWPKTPAKIVDVNYCEDAGKMCTSRTECVDAGGEVLGDYTCRENSLKGCCSKAIPQKTCMEKGGIICEAEKVCDGDPVFASDSDNCCIGDCIIEEVSECEVQGFLCKNQCSDTEETKQASCKGIQLCCGAKSGGGLWWLWLLIILIILTVLAIIFREKVKFWYFKIKSKFKKGPPVAPARPGFPPQGMQRPGMPPRPGMLFRPGMPIPGRPLPPPPGARMPMMPSRPVSSARILPQPRSSSKTDKELDETLKKLRDMGK